MLKCDISYCGIKCTECDVYLATMDQDENKRRELAEQYSDKNCTLYVEDIDCLGCHSERVSQKMCGVCAIRTCAQTKDIVTCAQCEYYSCELIDRYVPEGTDNRKVLDEMKKRIE